MIKTLRNFRRNSRGVTAIEYGLIASLVSIAAITALSSVGTSLNTTFTNVAGHLTAS